MTGRIKSYSSRKGFGFIESDFGDIFFHHSVLEDRNVKAGMKVECRLDKKKLVAKKVVLL